MRPLQRVETHLQRTRDLTGRRDRISTMRSSVSLAAAWFLRLLFFDNDFFAISLLYKPNLLMD
jgi:hypothetical protein